MAIVKYTFDGNATETTQYDGATYAKIADTAPNLHDVTKAVYTAPNGRTIDVPVENMTVTDTQSNGQIVGQYITASMTRHTVIAIILDQSGLWVYNQPGYGYCSLVEFAVPEEPTEGVSIGKKYLLYRLFPPYIARVLCRE